MSNELIAKEIEAERARREAEKSKPPKTSKRQVGEARFVWMAGSVFVDLLTAWLIWQLTAFLPYALVWIAAGAGGLLYSERLKERVGNNEDQNRIGGRGVVASAIAVFGMALLVGTVWMLRLESQWMNAVMEVTALVLFFFHLWQSYRYHSVDDEIVAANEEARSEEENARQIREVHRAARLVASRKVRDNVANEYRKEHGQALDAALAVYGAETLQVAPVSKNGSKPENPTNGER